MITVDLEGDAYEAFKNVFGKKITVNGCFFPSKKGYFSSCCGFGTVTIHRRRSYFIARLHNLRWDLRLGVPSNRSSTSWGSVPQYFWSHGSTSSWLFCLDKLTLREEPMFPPQMWNQYENTLDGEHRTINIYQNWRPNLMLSSPLRKPIGTLFAVWEWGKKELSSESF